MQQRTRVKICGLTRVDDVRCAVDAGADAIGLVFYEKSSRAVSLTLARQLRDTVPAFIDVVALFVNAPAEEVRAVIEYVQPDLLQFHGDETPDYCASFRHRYLRAFRVGAPAMNTPEAVHHACQMFPDAAAWLFDSYSQGYGGSGLAFDAGLLQGVQHDSDSRPLILAGGLNPQTVAAAIDSIHPYAVDVSSGVEVTAGIKSPEKIGAFMAAVTG